MARARIVEAQRKVNGKFTVAELEKHLAAYIHIDPRAVRLFTPDFRMAVDENGGGLNLSQLRARWDGHNNEARCGEEAYYGKPLKRSPNNWRE